MKVTDEKIYWGTEPTKTQFLEESDDNFMNSLSEFLNTYNFIATNEQKKEWFLEYVKTNRTDVSVKNYSDVSPKSFSTAGACARLFNNGLDYSDYLNEKLDGFVNSLKSDKSDENISTRRPSRIDGRLAFLIESLEIVIDEFIMSGYRDQSFDMTKWLALNNPSPVQHMFLKNRFRKLLNELQNIGNDKELSEGYSNLKRLHVKRFIELLTQIVETKKFRKTRVVTKKKVKSPEKVVAKVKVAEKDPETGVTSLAPAKIVGCNTVWVWNKKYRVLGFYKAIEGKDLTIKGSTILNFDEKLSTGKRIRKPKDIVPKIADMGKVDLKKVLTNIKAKPVTMRGRLGKETIILRVL